jgi:hypothetical protein
VLPLGGSITEGSVPASRTEWQEAYLRRPSANDPATVQNQTFQRSMKHGPPPADLGFDRVQAIATITQIYCSR